MANSIRTFLMFEGKAEEAMDFYVGLFGGKVIAAQRYGPGQPGKEGTIMLAEFEIGGQRLLCSDSSVRHAFSFTPSTSFFVECKDRAELDDRFTRLSQGGEVLMPPDNYGFSQHFCWCNDRFGVSWQLNLA